MNKWSELLVGLIFMIVPIVVAFYSADWWGATWDFWSAAGVVFKGGLLWMLVGIGTLFILLGISDLKG